jgi:DNA invertase Pin-like site-specific DNA recombinase
MLSMFATMAKQESARISERTIVGLKTARAKGKRLGRPPLPYATIRQVLTMNRENALGARRIAKQTAIPLGTVNAILTRDRKSLLADSNRGALQLPRS